MKKILFTALSLMALTSASAQDKGRVEVYNLDNFKLHVYYTNDVMNDASYIVEGRDGVVTMEEPLFKDNVAEFGQYLGKIGKPVVQRISDYHVGGTGSNPYLMPQGMPAFVKGPVYGGMMQGFAQQFGDKIVSMPTGNAGEVAFGSTETLAGVPFLFSHGVATDFPAASILIGGKAYYTHWAPAKSHLNALQLPSAESADAQVNELTKALKSGAELFIGGHGGAAKADAVNFKIEYLKTVKKLLAENKTAEAFVAALKKAYPGLPGEEGLDGLAAALYK